MPSFSPPLSALNLVCDRPLTRVRVRLTQIADEIDEDDENVHAFQIDDSKIDVSRNLFLELTFLLTKGASFRKSKSGALISSTPCLKSMTSETIL